MNALNYIGNGIIGALTGAALFVSQANAQEIKCEGGICRIPVTASDLKLEKKVEDDFENIEVLRHVDIMNIPERSWKEEWLDNYGPEFTDYE